MTKRGDKHMNYQNYRIESREDLESELLKQKGEFYVYLLCKAEAGKERPFYVGLGQRDRLFLHEEEAERSHENNDKLTTIRSVWASGQQIIRYIEGFYEKEPWEREAELINHFGLLKDGTGTLTNSQRYEADNNGLRKYAQYGNEFPPNFKHRNTRLKAGTEKPSSDTTVYGKIYSVLETHPGVTGEELALLLLKVDFKSNPSAYTQSGEVKLPWLAGYIDGGFYKKNRCIQEY